MQLLPRSRAAPGDIGIALLVPGSSAAFATLVRAAGPLWLRARHPERLVRTSWERPSWGSAAKRHIARCVASAVISGALATAVGIGHPYWAMVSAVVPLAARDLRPQLVRGIHRIVGTTAGTLLAGVPLCLDPRGLRLILTVVVRQVDAGPLTGRNYAVALVMITTLALRTVHPVPRQRPVRSSSTATWRPSSAW